MNHDEKKRNYILYAFILKIMLIITFYLHETKAISFTNSSLFAEDKKNMEVNVEKNKKNLPRFLEDLPPLNTEKLTKDEIGKYLNLIETKKEEVILKEKILFQKEQSLKNLERVITKKTEALEEERLFLMNTIKKEKDLKNERTESLVEYFKKMDPKKSGAIFEDLDEDLAIELFNQLPVKVSTAILENLPAERAKDFTESFGRVGSAAEYDLIKEMNASLKEAFSKCKDQD